MAGFARRPTSSPSASRRRRPPGASRRPSPPSPRFAEAVFADALLLASAPASRRLVDAAAWAASGSSNVFGALTRRVPIRSGRVEGSAASTPFSSFFGFGLDFFGFSTLSAMRLRVYGSRSGRGARPPSYRHKNDFRRAVLLPWVAFACSRD